MSPRRQRLIFVVVAVIFCCAGTLLVLNALRDNLLFFYTPSELLAMEYRGPERLRLGGLVVKDSIRHDEDGTIHFLVTDGVGELQVAYRGTLPNLFREGQGVVVEGSRINDKAVIASTVLAKHDEKYIPKEVVEKLKTGGYWQGDQKP